MPFIPPLVETFKIHVAITFQQNTVQSLYNTPNMDLDITVMLWLLNFFYHGILQRNYWKMHINWSFFYNFFVKLSLYDPTHIQCWSPVAQW